MVLPVYLYGHPVIRKETEEIDASYPQLKELIENMYETMYAAEGIGLAAPQIGKSLQMIVLDDGNGLIELINPELLEASEELQDGPEGCLSVPGYYGDVKRSQRIKVRALNRHGKVIVYEPEGFLARIFQHEMDHLVGTLFIEKATNLRKVEE